ncbi:uncharacterized protein MYCGRDRAFT_97851 [Zymoseptoria tritici IPO323]|uniref:Uncharacterized protein n=1 Tax=Zymoseptoria tritici (strain CBS 115943 / IPO323) TaxID=336722 RepID=F9XRK5_ZYMTI|nr:uncharacterized protein MYCGRDRAFT_97851 [Zymoseptoria tritici IPO323]EGP82114.1 hypothetical protein MYCGRDRAFT_97851 [Zymoseptoria tritici IPO323]
MSIKHATKTKRAPSHLLAPIIRLRRHEVLDILLPTLREHHIPVPGSAVKEAIALPLPLATIYLDRLFALEWDVNTALSNTEPPVLSIALADIMLVCWLLRRGADPNTPCDIDCTPLSIAVREAPVPVVELLLHHAQDSHNGHLVFHTVHRPDPKECTSLTRTLHRYNKPIDDILYQDARSYNLRAHFVRGTPLYYACKNGKPSVALTLIELGADPDKPCMRYNQAVGPTPREVAATNGWSRELMERLK